MTDFVITQATSIFANSGNAFDNGSTDPDTLTVELGASLVTTDPSSTGAFLDGPGTWTAKIAGFVYGPYSGISVNGIGTDTSKISITGDGQVGGNLRAIHTNAITDVVNHGLVKAGSGSGIDANAALTVTNTGMIDGYSAGIYNKSDLILTNAGTVYGGAIGVIGNGDVSIKNTGTLGGGQSALKIYAGATHSITNSGLIGGEIDINSGAATLTNSGMISDNVSLAGEADTLANVAKQGKKKALAGEIGGDVTLGSGDDTLINALKTSFKKSNGDKKGKAVAGTIEGSVNLGEGNDTFTNYAKVSFKKGNGKKKTKEASGEIDGSINLGDGDDTFNGGNNAETVLDGNGSDTINLKGGHDTFVTTGTSGADGVDTIDAGKGTDLYDASGTTNDLILNLSSTDQTHDFSFFIVVQANSATRDGAVNNTVDTITNFEDAAGGSGRDILFGTGGNNHLQGNGGIDTLHGLAGDDHLQGGGNSDVLYGDRGADRLEGGDDPDTFYYDALSDSGTTAATRDLIVDFEDDGAGGERISLVSIDANINTAADDAFTFIGTNVLFSSTAGELRAIFSAQGQIVEGDVDGDGAADFSFEILDPTHAITLSGANNEDFVL